MRYTAGRPLTTESGNAPLARFRAAASAVGAEVELLPSAALPARLLALASRGDVAVSPALAQTLHRLPEPTTEPDMAISLALAGIARTGTVIVAEPTHSDRLAYLLAPRHVVVLAPDRIVSDVGDTGALLRQSIAGGVRFLTYVTGPSRTSDIEQVLTIGAHGPRELRVLVVIDGANNAH